MGKIIFRYFSIDENDQTRREREISRSVVKNFAKNECSIENEFPIYQERFDFSNMYIKVLVGLKGRIIKNIHVAINKEAPYESYMYEWPPLYEQ
ncbi:MAG: hypothetical protein ACTHK8_03410 [Ginsengibacter sp.]